MSKYKFFTNDILLMIFRIEKAVGKNFYFEVGNDLYDSTLMRLQVIGETIKKIPKDELSKYNDVSWKTFIRFRDFVSHNYFIVNCNALRKIILTDMPKLKIAIKDMKKRDIN